MQLRDKVIVVPVGQCIGSRLRVVSNTKAQAHHRRRLGWRQVQAAAKELGAWCAMRCLTRRRYSQVVALTEKAAGPVDLFCSNAGIAVSDPDFENAASAPDAAGIALAHSCHVACFAARALLPGMIARKQGYFLNPHRPPDY